MKSLLNAPTLIELAHASLAQAVQPTIEESEAKELYKTLYQQGFVQESLQLAKGLEAEGSAIATLMLVVGLELGMRVMARRATEGVTE